MEEIGWRLTVDQELASAEIDSMRREIDGIDEQIAQLLHQRLRLAQEIGAVKADSGLPVLNSSREQEVIKNVSSVADADELRQAIARIYQVVLAESRAQQVTTAAGDDSRQPTTQYFTQVTVIGLGAIGGALARRIKQVFPSTRIVGCDKPEVLKKAELLGLIDSAEENAAIAVKKAGLILLCAGPRQNLHLLQEIASSTKRRQVILDVTSTKRAICVEAESLPLKADFVGGHPLFGTHKSGVESSTTIDVADSRFCLTATNKSTELTLRRLTRWLSDLGLNVLKDDAGSHDHTIARTSHLVQLLAVALGNVLFTATSNGSEAKHLALSGNGLKGLSRLMSSPSELWLEIIEQNKDEILSAIAELKHQLTDLECSISEDRAALIRTAFQRAEAVGRQIDQI